MRVCTVRTPSDPEHAVRPSAPMGRCDLAAPCSNHSYQRSVSGGNRVDLLEAQRGSVDRKHREPEKFTGEGQSWRSCCAARLLCACGRACGVRVSVHGQGETVLQLRKKIPERTLNTNPAQVEAYLRFNDIKYERRNTTFGKTPKGRLPFLQHGEDHVADSRFIIKYLEHTYGSKLKVKQLADPAEIGKGVAITRLCEEHAYFVAQVFRMYTDEVCQPT